MCGDAVLSVFGGVGCGDAVFECVGCGDAVFECVGWLVVCGDAVLSMFGGVGCGDAVLSVLVGIVCGGETDKLLMMIFTVFFYATFFFRFQFNTARINAHL